MIIANLMALALAVQPAGEVNWVLIAHDVDGQYFLDPASVRREGNLSRFRARAVARPGGVDGTYSALFEMIFDCSARKSGFEAGELFDAQGASIGSRRIPPAEVEMRVIRPGASDDQMFGTVCRDPAGARP